MWTSFSEVPPLSLSLPFHLFIGVSVVVVPVPLSLLAFLTPPCWVWIGWSRIPQQRRKLFNIERESALYDVPLNALFRGCILPLYFNSALLCWMLASDAIFWPFTTIGLFIHLHMIWTFKTHSRASNKITRAWSSNLFRVVHPVVPDSQFS